MKTEIKIKQNSKEWHEHRKNYINASEVASLMGLNPFESKEELIKKKIFKIKFKTNDAIEHGKKTEKKANLFFSLKMKKNYTPTVFINDIFSASLDGYHNESNSLLEIKCPINKESKSWEDFFKKDIIPIYYWVQIQCQIFCSECDKAYFLVYFNDNDYKFIEVIRDDNFIQKMIFESKLYKVEFDRILIEFKNK
ncbi:MAG: lambda-exonuclease family protein [Candidatus Phytoplasma pyri]